MFCQDGKNIYLAATRELDSVYIKTEAGHGTFTNKQGNEYTLKNNFSAAEYKVVDPTRTYNIGKYLYTHVGAPTYIKQIWIDLKRAITEI